MRWSMVLPALASVFMSARVGDTDELPKTMLKAQSFDRDPQWQARHNRVVPREYPTVVQDFGYSGTNVAGLGRGEMGGLVTRASEAAFYADRIESLTLDDKFSASGTFAITKTTPGGGAFFGFFRAQQPGGAGRPTGSLGLNLDCEHSGGRLAVRLITEQNQSCGTFVTPFVPGKFRPTPIRNDGTRYAWSLDYDPQAVEGRGRFTFTFRSLGRVPEELLTTNLPADLPESHRQEALARFPNTMSFAVDLPPGYRQQGTIFDHFGLMNMMKAGGQMSIYFDDLHYAGRTQDFTSDPQWDSARNRGAYRANDVAGAHNFGFSETNHAMGRPGEIGGTFWRTDLWGFYADKIASVNFDQRLEARGKVILTVGAPDSDMCFGWFQPGEDSLVAPNAAGPFLGVKVGGPTRVGHYFLPVFIVNEQVSGRAEQGPVLRPGQAYEWSLVYDPEANGGLGAITATLGSQSVTHNLKPGQRSRARGISLDHFGLFSIGPGGQIVKLYLDDLQYTVGRQESRGPR